MNKIGKLYQSTVNPQFVIRLLDNNLNIEVVRNTIGSTYSVVGTRSSIDSLDKYRLISFEKYYEKCIL